MNSPIEIGDSVTLERKCKLRLWRYLFDCIHYAKIVKSNREISQYVFYPPPIKDALSHGIGYVCLLSLRDRA